MISFSLEEPAEDSSISDESAQLIHDNWQVSLFIGEHDREITVPPYLLRFDGPHATLKLKDVIQLLRENSAIGSQNVTNVRYCDEFGIWKPLPSNYVIEYPETQNPELKVQTKVRI